MSDSYFGPSSLGQSLPQSNIKVSRSNTIRDLLQAKAFSDRKDYRGKHRLLRKLLDERPHEFFRDSQQGAFTGITHQSGFRMHLPNRLVANVAFGKPELAIKKVAEEVKQAKLDRAWERFERWRHVPDSLVILIKEGIAVPESEKPIHRDPDALIAKLAQVIAKLPQSQKIDPFLLLPEYELNDSCKKLAAADYPGTNLFTPSIPVDAFNNAVWSDAIPNPFGTRSTFGDNSQSLRTPPQAAALVSGIIAGAGAKRNSDHVSPWDVALAAGETAGKGWLGGLVLGRTVGTLANLPPEGQKTLQDAGLWGGMLLGAVKKTFQ